jgi:hypothetical protein
MVCVAGVGVITGTGVTGNTWVCGVNIFVNRTCFLRPSNVFFVRSGRRSVGFGCASGSYFYTPFVLV